LEDLKNHANNVLETGSQVQQNTPKVTIQDSSGKTENQSYDISGYGKLRDANNELKEIKQTTGLDFKQNPFIYGSGYYDSESGLQYMGARYYSPDLERFMAMDSYDLINRYNYANGNPIMFIDPSGHLPVWSILNYLLNGAAAAAGVASAVLSGGATTPIVMGIVGATSGVTGISAQVLNDTGHSGKLSTGLNIASSVLGAVGGAMDILGLAKVGVAMEPEVAAMEGGEEVAIWEDQNPHQAPLNNLAAPPDVVAGPEQPVDISVNGDAGEQDWSVGDHDALNGDRPFGENANTLGRTEEKSSLQRLDKGMSREDFYNSYEPPPFIKFNHALRDGAFGDHASNGKLTFGENGIKMVSSEEKRIEEPQLGEWKEMLDN